MSQNKPEKRTIRQVKIRLRLILRFLLSIYVQIRSWLKPYISNLPNYYQKAIPLANQVIQPIRKAISRLSFRLKLAILTIIALVGIVLSVNSIYKAFYGPAIVKNYTLFIHDKDTFGEVVSILKENNCLISIKNFERLADLKDYPEHIKPGCYKLEQGWSIAKLIQILRSGAQTPVMVIFNNIRTREELAGKLARQLQSDSVSFLTFFKNDSIARQLGFGPETLPALFIPNSYSIYWTTTPSGFLSRMKREYDQFWNESRRQKAKEAGLTVDQVATLASIVQEESNKNEDKPVIAGVYLNRLRNKWPLQADPTIRFALGDFTIRRVLTAQLSIESPYNTYKNAGLPPGPINFPEISSLESVLNYAKHEYFYFCAKEDFSGYHNFAKSLSEHNRNARKYQEALNKMKVFK